MTTLNIALPEESNFEKDVCSPPTSVVKDYDIYAKNTLKPVDTSTEDGTAEDPKKAKNTDDHYEATVKYNTRGE